MRKSVKTKNRKEAATKVTAMSRLKEPKAAKATTEREAFPVAQPAPGIELVLADALQWMAERDENSVHAIVTDPPYGLIEFDEREHTKLRKGKGGVWRIPPSFDGSKRSPLPRFGSIASGVERAAG